MQVNIKILLFILALLPVGILRGNIVCFGLLADAFGT